MLPKPSAANLQAWMPRNKASSGMNGGANSGAAVFVYELKRGSIRTPQLPADVITAASILTQICVKSWSEKCKQCNRVGKGRFLEQWGEVTLQSVNYP